MSDWLNSLSAFTPPRRATMEFLQTHLPANDLDHYPFDLFLQFADHALFLRESAPWCKTLDEEIFFHYVLFPRVNDEDLSFHRQVFYDALWPRIQNLPSTAGIVLEVNRWCHEMASYELTDERTASPLTVFRSGSGRCGEESAFLVAALRSVGVPARQVYVPRWSHCDDNHAWVEALCDSEWRFLGACEPEPVLDRGWFNTVASRAVLVRSRLFGEGSSPLHGQSIGCDSAVTYYNQTARYAPVAERIFRALVNGKPAAGAVFQLQILNEASFHTIATLTADEQGEARACLGSGSLHVLVLLGELRAEGICESTELTLNLSPVPCGGTDWTDFDFCAPQATASMPPLSQTQRVYRAVVRRDGTALRTARTESFYRSDPAHPEWDALLRSARGNCEEIRAFLRGANTLDRERLLRTLTPKDLRDTDLAVLEDHFTRLPPRPDSMPEEIYWRYVACPRIALEKLSPWRSASHDTLHKMDKNCARIASLRREGIPARLRPLDGAPEVWKDGSFCPVFPKETGTLPLTCPQAPTYRQRWTLSRRVSDGWKLLDLSNQIWEDGVLTVSLPTGQYRIVTTTRLPNGNQFAACRDFPILSGESQSVDLRLRSFALADMLFWQELPVTSAVTLDGINLPDIFHSDDRPSLLFWQEEGAEPTEHILNELTSCRQGLAALPIHIVFLLRSRDSANHPTISALLAQWPAAHVLLDDWAYDLEDLARRLACDPDTPPLVVACDGSGHAVYAHSGYQVGLAELLARVAAWLCGM